VFLVHSVVGFPFWSLSCKSHKIRCGHYTGAPPSPTMSIFWGFLRKNRLAGAPSWCVYFTVYLTGFGLSRRSLGCVTPKTVSWGSGACVRVDAPSKPFVVDSVRHCWVHNLVRHGRNIRGMSLAQPRGSAKASCSASKWFIATGVAVSNTVN